MTHSGDCPAGIGPFRCDCGAAAEQAKANLSTAEFVAAKLAPTQADATNPSHYRIHPSGIEAIQITEHMNFNLGNVVKYVWRTDEKGEAIENLKKARWYINREIQRRERQDHAKRFTVVPGLG